MDYSKDGKMDPPLLAIFMKKALGKLPFLIVILKLLKEITKRTKRGQRLL